MSETQDTSASEDKQTGGDDVDAAASGSGYREVVVSSRRRVLTALRTSRRDQAFPRAILLLKKKGEGRTQMRKQETKRNWSCTIRKNKV